jgi:hypothetical protein
MVVIWTFHTLLKNKWKLQFTKTGTANFTSTYFVEFLLIMNIDKGIIFHSSGGMEEPKRSLFGFESKPSHM